MPKPETPSRVRGRSLAVRVTLLTTLAAGLSVLAVSGGAYVTVHRQLRSSLDAQLDSQLLRRARAAAEHTRIGKPANVEWPAGAAGSADVQVVLLRADRLTIALSSRPTDGPRLGPSELAVARGSSQQSLRTITRGDEQFRVAAVPSEGANRTALVVLQSLDQRDRVLSRLAHAMLLLSGLAVLVVAGGGWAVARTGLRPIRNLTTAVENAALTERLQQIPMRGDDEVARLAGAFNRMLSALDASRSRQRGLLADAGDELRTPLTALRTNVDLLTQLGADDALRPGSEAVRDLLSDIRVQIDVATSLISDLVDVARDEPTKT